jgi:hypothetical protein
VASRGGGAGMRERRSWKNLVTMGIRGLLDDSVQ